MILRPEVYVLLNRWHEVLLSAALALLGLWLASRGGWFFAPVGGLVTLLGAALVVIGWRRLRFRRADLGPGVVRVVEGQLAYLGPHGGGFVGLADLVELGLIADEAGVRCWRLVPHYGTPVMVPVAALGSEVLYDLFASLPGLDMAALLAALDQTDLPNPVVWRRPARLR